jgi:hypothetical protein
MQANIEINKVMDAYGSELRRYHILITTKGVIKCGEWIIDILRQVSENIEN